MRSKISCFNTLLKKNLTRFAPVWAGYQLLLLLMLAVSAGNGIDYYFVEYFVDLFQMMVPIHAAFALIVVQAVFGDLFSPRMCHTLHAMPVRRLEIYGTNLITGSLCGLVPTAVMALVAAPLLARSTVTDAVWLALYWWGCAAGQYLFFFGAGVCCAMLAGNRLGQAVLYALVNFGSVIAYVLVNTAFTPLLYGVVTPESCFMRFSPVTYMLSFRPIELEAHHTPINDLEVQLSGTYTWGWGWSYILALAAIGAALLIAGWLLYRRRDLEKAGDFLAVKAMEPVCLVCLSLTAGALGCAVGRGAAVDLGLPLLALGMAIGWFAGKMLLERTTKVFRLSAFRGLALLAVILAGALGLTKLDPLGIQDRIPDADEIQMVSVNYTPMENRMTQTALDFHALALTDRWDGDKEVNNLTATLTYYMKNGDTVRRNYVFPVDSAAGNKARLLYSSIPYMFSGQVGKMNDPAYTATWENDRPTARTLLALVDTPISVSVGGQALPEELLTKETVELLINALIADSEEGNLSYIDAFHPAYTMPNGGTRAPYGSLEIILPPVGEATRLNLAIYQDCAHTLEALDRLGITWDSIREQYEARYPE